MHCSNQDGSLSIARPDGSRVVFDSTQSAGSTVCALTVTGGVGPSPCMVMPSIVSFPRATVWRTGGIRCGRTQIGTATVTKTYTASVIAIAATDRRTTAPTATPSATANTPYATGTMPRMSNATGVMRDGSDPRVSLCAASSGSAHQVTASASTPIVAAAVTRGSPDRKSTRLNSSHPSISYAVF